MLGKGYGEWEQLDESERLDWLAFDYRRQTIRDELLNNIKGKDGKISEFAANAYVQLILMDT